MKLKLKYFTGPGTAEELTRAPMRGLGDAVAVVAKPIAAGIDALLKTDLKNCGSCNGRIASLNARFPFNPDKP